MACMYGRNSTNKTEKFFKYQSTIYMNLNLTSQIKMPDHKLRRQVIELCQKVGKPLLKLSTKDYVDNGLGQLVKEFDGQAGLVNI